MVTANDQKLTLVSKDGTHLQVNPEIRNMSILIQNMLEDSGDDYSEPVPCPGVPTFYLEKIIEYCELHNYRKTQTDLIHPLPSKNPQVFISD